MHSLNTQQRWIQIWMLLLHPVLFEPSCKWFCKLFRRYVFDTCLKVLPESETRSPNTDTHLSVFVPHFAMSYLDMASQEDAKKKNCSLLIGNWSNIVLTFRWKKFSYLNMNYIFLFFKGQYLILHKAWGPSIPIVINYITIYLSSHLFLLLYGTT